MQHQELLTVSRAVNIDFPVRQITVTNLTTAWQYLRKGGNDIPSELNYNYAIPPQTIISYVMYPSVQAFGVRVTPGNGSVKSFSIIFSDTLEPVGATPAVGPVFEPDRNFVIQSTVNWNGRDIAPHAFTTRATITIPAGKVAKIMVVALYVERVTVATTPGYPELWLLASVSGSINTCTVRNNVAGASSDFNLASNITLPAGGTISLATADNSVGGTVAYYGSIMYATYDPG